MRFANIIQEKRQIGKRKFWFIALSGTAYVQFLYDSPPPKGNDTQVVSYDLDGCVNNTKIVHEKNTARVGGVFVDILLRNAIFFPDGKIDIFT